MKRDLDLVRQLMAIFEELPPGPFAQFSGSLDNVEPVVVMEHLSLMIDAGLIEGRCRVIPESPDGGGFLIQRITWKGHDFLDAARNDAVWAKTKERLKMAGSWSFGLLMEVLKDEGKRRLGTFLSQNL